MSQNTSSAVMQQRSEPHDSLDDFPTQPWATRALCKHVINDHYLFQQTVWEPACNRGHMAMPLSESFREVLASDIYAYGYGIQGDFLIPGLIPWDNGLFVDWVITNPPFRLAEQFIARALDIATVGVAMIVGKDTSAIADIIGVHESVIYNALAKMNGKTLPAPEKRRRSA